MKHVTTNKRGTVYSLPTAIVWGIFSTIDDYQGLLEDAKTGQLALFASRSKARLVASTMTDVAVRKVKVSHAKR